MQEQKTVSDLINVLKSTKMTDDCIVQILASIIQSQIMYGGTLQDKIDFQIEKTEREGKLNGTLY